MSVEELQATIEKISVDIKKISADIERQKEVLNKLETSKSLIQRQLNAVLDPLARLPLEISSEIFIQCLPPIVEPGAARMPMLLLDICNSWSRIAISTPALWTTIRVQFPRPEGFAKILENWLRHARNHPLSISLRGSFDDDIVAVVGQHAGQLENLEIYHDQQHTLIRDPLSGLGSRSFPSLKSLTIGGESSGGYPSLNPDSILDLFHRAPNLIECTFDRVFTPAGHPPTLKTLVLPNLRHLNFGRSLEHFYSDNGLLWHITLPGLQTLIVSMDSSEDDDEYEEVLIAFLKRSSPPLQKLRICELDSDDSFDFPEWRNAFAFFPP
ncbi:hypothetical protein DFH07DRAFT_919594 [Mycena maculata]|uniref:F-box domain-containing protein n=1 Tax=Mycena maculata TaxID=230809 RepID=A0AAD7NDT1_9AGAR|nr:hypothetical protein DFH07DRAFT_919594 [Mycena maculata]